MSYFETGSASDVNNLLGKLRSAMAANGWDTNYNALTAGGGTRCHMSKGGMTVNFRTGFNNELPVADAAERSARQGNWSWNYYWGNPATFWRPDWIALNVGTGVNLGSSWHIQPGAPGSGEGKGLASMALASGGISRYWIFIFDNPDTVLLIFEPWPERFEHIAFGRLHLVQPVQSGGEWYSASRTINSNYGEVSEICEARAWLGTCLVRLVDSRWAIADQLDGWNHTVAPGAAWNHWYTSWIADLGVPLFEASVQYPQYDGFPGIIPASYLEAEGRSILHPIPAYKAREQGGHMLLGYFPHIARTSMRPYVAGDPIAGVGESWVAFPSHFRESPWNNKAYQSKPSNPAEQAANFYGTGIAVRRP